MEIRIQLPPWVAEFVKTRPPLFQGPEDRMGLAIDLARENVIRKTGGPFGAALFDSEGNLVAPGVNLVVPGNSSILHAEMVALVLAQQKLRQYDLSDGGGYHYELAASTEPCAMCFGALHWSGITSLLCGARDEDARSAGFDEGPKLPNWQEALESRGIRVFRDILRQEASAVLKLYVEMGGVIYNSGRNQPEYMK